MAAARANLSTFAPQTVVPSQADAAWMGTYASTLSKLGQVYLAGIQSQQTTAADLIANLELNVPGNPLSTMVADAKHLQTIQAGLSALIAQYASSQAQVASLQQQLATPSSKVTGTAPTASTPAKIAGTSPQTQTASGSGTIVAGLAVLATLGAGAWWWHTRPVRKK